MYNVGTKAFSADAHARGGHDRDHWRHAHPNIKIIYIVNACFEETEPYDLFADPSAAPRHPGWPLCNAMEFY